MKEVQDYYFKKAKAENYPARSVYKLQEIDARFRIFKKGMKILDLGASPGSWSLWSGGRAGAGGQVIACDIQEACGRFPENIKFFRENIFDFSDSFNAVLRQTAPFDVVMSDMAPSTTGSRFTDQARSFDLAQAAFEVAQAWLGPRGAFIVKIFMGPDVKGLQKDMSLVFKQVKSFKPKSSRPESRETFLIGMDFYKSMDII